MNCPRESEVLDALTTARWPDELHAHAGGCALCADLVAVAAALHEDLQDAMHDVVVPASGLVWWRAQRREREEATRAAARTITLVQTASVLGAIAVALTILGGVSVMSDTWRDWLAGLTSAVRFESFAVVPQWNVPLMLAAAACLVLAPVALYFVVAEK